MIKELLKFLRIFVTPSCWLRNDGVNRELDKWVRNGLKNPEFEKIDAYYVRFNGAVMWIGNYPYAYCKKSSVRGLPTRRTVFWFHDAYSKWALETA